MAASFAVSDTYDSESVQFLTARKEATVASWTLIRLCDREFHVAESATLGISVEPILLAIPVQPKSNLLLGMLLSIQSFRIRIRPENDSENLALDYVFPTVQYTSIKSPDKSVLASDSLFHVRCLDIDLTASFVVMNNKITIYNYGLTEGFPATGIALLQGGEIAGTMENISIAMTPHIQETRNATTHQGTALYPEAVGVVRWAWLILPIALVLLSAVFLVLRMLRNGSSGKLGTTPLWKSSLMPVLIYCLDHWNGNELRIDCEADMLTEAEGAKVRLQLNADGDRKRLIIMLVCDTQIPRHSLL
ncbi:hypothetical protein IWX49DRAFT_555301 [Phyllosticta citricarpa]